uniref:Uncharacterized protein n=1 Tax=Oryza meridionalis TaxID=40149 RepID=A0A0E0EFC8_9ORYZ
MGTLWTGGGTMDLSLGELGLHPKDTGGRIGTYSKLPERSLGYIGKQHELLVDTEAERWALSGGGARRGGDRGAGGLGRAARQEAAPLPGQRIQARSWGDGAARRPGGCAAGRRCREVALAEEGDEGAAPGRRWSGAGGEGRKPAATAADATATPMGVRRPRLGALVPVQGRGHAKGPEVAPVRADLVARGRRSTRSGGDPDQGDEGGGGRSGSSAGRRQRRPCKLLARPAAPEHVSAADGMDGDEVGQDVDIATGGEAYKEWRNERPCSVYRYGGAKDGRGARRASLRRTEARLGARRGWHGATAWLPTDARRRGSAQCSPGSTFCRTCGGHVNLAGRRKEEGQLGQLR